MELNIPEDVTADELLVSMKAAQKAGSASASVELLLRLHNLSVAVQSEQKKLQRNYGAIPMNLLEH